MSAFIAQSLRSAIPVNGARMPKIFAGLAIINRQPSADRTQPPSPALPPVCACPRFRRRPPLPSVPHAARQGRYGQRAASMFDSASAGRLQRFGLGDESQGFARTVEQEDAFFRAGHEDRYRFADLASDRADGVGDICVIGNDRRRGQFFRNRRIVDRGRGAEAMSGRSSASEKRTRRAGDPARGQSRGISRVYAVSPSSVRQASRIA